MTSEVTSPISDELSFTYSSFDRCIIRGYLRNLFSPGSVVNFFKNNYNVHKLDKESLSLPTQELVRHIELFSQAQGVPIQWWKSVKFANKKNGGKSEYVSKHYLEKYQGTQNKVLAILSDTERTKTLENGRGKGSKTLYRVSKQVKFYYIYFYDKVLGGLCYLKICTYLPFEIEFYFNGHHYIEHHLKKEGISYKMEGNCFTDIGDVKRLQELSSSLTGMKVLERIEEWKGKIFKFNKGTYSKQHPTLQHEWYSSQIEVCSNLVFKSKTFGTSFWNKMLLLFSLLAVPDVITKVFRARPREKNRKTKTTQRRYDIDSVVKHWFRGNSIKMYNKTGKLIRIETTINHPAKMGGTKLKKSLCFLQSLYWKGLECNTLYFDYCKQIDRCSVSNDQLEHFKHSVEKSNGKKVAAPDLRKERQIALLCQLIRPKFVCAPFRLKELRRYISEFFTESNQIRYEMDKILVRGVAEKLKGSNYYRVTMDGFSQIWTLIMGSSHFVNPLLSRSYKREYKMVTGNVLSFEQGFMDIRKGLKSLFISLTDDL